MPKGFCADFFLCVKDVPGRIFASTRFGVYFFLRSLFGQFFCVNVFWCNFFCVKIVLCKGFSV